MLHNRSNRATIGQNGLAECPRRLGKEAARRLEGEAREHCALRAYNSHATILVYSKNVCQEKSAADSYCLML